MILLDDGNIELCVKRVTGSEIETEVVDGGTITDRKGVNLPGVHLNMPYMSEADEQDILFGFKHGFDIIARLSCAMRMICAASGVSGSKVAGISR